MFSYYTADGRLLSIRVEKNVPHMHHVPNMHHIPHMHHVSQPMITAPIPIDHIPKQMPLLEHFAASSQDTAFEIDPYILRIEQLIKDKMWKEKVQESVKKIQNYSDTNEKNLKQFKDSINNLNDVIAAKNIKPVKDTPDIIIDEPVDPVDKENMERTKKEEAESKKTEMEQKMNMIANTKTTMRDRIKSFEDTYAEETRKFQESINIMYNIQNEVGGVLKYVEGLRASITPYQEQIKTLQEEIDRDTVAFARKPPPNMSYTEATMSLVIRRSQVSSYQKRVDFIQKRVDDFGRYMGDIDEMKKLFEVGIAGVQRAPALQKELSETVPQLKALLLQI
jgi:DNA repair exonuclease SbcCD ATPase subunit